MFYALLMCCSKIKDYCIALFLDSLYNNPCPLYNKYNTLLTSWPFLVIIYMNHFKSDTMLNGAAYDYKYTTLPFTCVSHISHALTIIWSDYWAVKSLAQGDKPVLALFHIYVLHNLIHCVHALSVNKLAMSGKSTCSWWHKSIAFGINDMCILIRELPDNKPGLAVAVANWHAWNSSSIPVPLTTVPHTPPKKNSPDLHRSQEWHWHPLKVRFSGQIQRNPMPDVSGFCLYMIW